MNPDDFEKRMEQQPFQAMPPEWREKILKNAKRSILERKPQVWWRSLLWPCPQAWAGLAAVWFVIFALNMIGDSGPRPAFELSATPLSPEFVAVMAEQRKLLAELLPPPDPPPVGHRQEPADRPRSKNEWQPGPATTQVLELPPKRFFVC